MTDNTWLWPAIAYNYFLLSAVWRSAGAPARWCGSCIVWFPTHHFSIEVLCSVSSVVLMIMDCKLRSRCCLSGRKASSGRIIQRMQFRPSYHYMIIWWNSNILTKYYYDTLSDLSKAFIYWFSFQHYLRILTNLIVQDK